MSKKNTANQTANISNSTKKKVSVSQAISSTKDDTKR